MIMDKGALQECLFKEAEIVQDIISRMSNNQFYIKAWSVTLIVGTLLLKGNIYHSFLAFMPWLIFWVYDSYFLRLEKLYRAHYEWLINNRSKSDQFLLELDRSRLEARLKENLKERFSQKVPCITQIMFTKSVLPFYIFLLAMILLFVSTGFLTQGKLI